MNPYNSLRERFSEFFPGVEDLRACCVPAHVNLLGEHLGHNKLPALGMAAGQQLLVAFAPSESSEIRIAGVGSRFTPLPFKNEPDIAPGEPGEGASLYKAAVARLNDALAPATLPGMRLLVESAFPAGGGPGSSSALVVACAMAYLRVIGSELDVDIGRLALAELLAEAEPHAGTSGGGVDQAAALMSKRGHATKIDACPLKVEYVPLLDDHIFVACDCREWAAESGASANGHSAVQGTCRLIAALVEKQAKEEFGEEIEIPYLGELWYGPLCLTDSEASDLIEAALPNRGATLPQLADRIGLSVEMIREQWLGETAEPADGFPLRATARHLVSEYKRVEMGRDLLLAQDGEGFGELMNTSHRSCAENCGINSPPLDALVAAAQKAGALGSRMIGAAMGGYTVSLIPANAMAAFTTTLKTSFYSGRGTSEDTILPLQSTGGASYVSL